MQQSFSGLMIKKENKLATARQDTGDSFKPKNRLTVLHVDDDPNDAALLQAAILKAKVGFELANIHDGEQAIAYLSGLGKYHDRMQHRMPSLILLDLKMPRANGFEILQWIRQHPTLKDLPVIVLSGSELKEDIQRAYAAGANSYLVKPLAFRSLVDLVQNINSVWLAANSHPQRLA
jgi:CheY-like chemotaxis protein